MGSRRVDIVVGGAVVAVVVATVAVVAVLTNSDLDNHGIVGEHPALQAVALLAVERVETAAASGSEARNRGPPRPPLQRLVKH